MDTYDPAPDESPVDERAQTYHVSEYLVSRHYGGPEEGGWWYDWWEFVRVHETCTDVDEARARVGALKEAQKILDCEYGKLNRYSVIGTPDAEFRFEETPGASQTTERPRWE